MEGSSRFDIDVRQMDHVPRRRSEVGLQVDPVLSLQRRHDLLVDVGTEMAGLLDRRKEHLRMPAAHLQAAPDREQLDGRVLRSGREPLNARALQEMVAPRPPGFR